MAASTSILSDKLHEYPQQDVIDGSSSGPDSVLEDCLNQHDGVLPVSYTHLTLPTIYSV